MNRAASLYQTTIGKKIVMAVSGVVWVGYVVGHLAGNLLVFAGPDAINEYSAFLHATPVVLWATRVLLVAALATHIIASTQLTLANFEARPIGYGKREDVATTYAARTMIWSGPILLLFIVYHLAHLTVGVAPGTPYDPHNVYNNIVRGFQTWWVTALYLISMTALALHLYHGAWSFFQTLGLNHPKYNSLRRRFAEVLTALVIIGFISIPLSVVAGVLEPVRFETADGE